MSVPKIGETGRELARRLGRRAKGVVIPEIAALFKVSEDVARNFILKMVREGVLRRTLERRRRPESVEWARGAGGFVYTATKQRGVKEAWVDSQKRRASPLGRSR